MPIAPARVITYKDHVEAVIAEGHRRVWPVDGNGEPTKRGEIGPNGKPYSDGQFSMEGKYRRYPDGRLKRHTGIDLPALVGAPVLAAASGRVKSQSYVNGYGKVVLIDHGDGTTSVYAHLNERTVKAGAIVKIGQEIGKVGMSGNSGNRGSHLHFEVLSGSNAVLAREAKRLDPSLWVANGKPSP